MKTVFLGMALALALALAGVAQASDYCPGSRPEKTAAADIQSLFQEKGWVAKLDEVVTTISYFGVEDSCYEVKGTDKDGRRVEVYVKPETGEIVHVKHK